MPPRLAVWTWLNATSSDENWRGWNNRRDFTIWRNSGLWSWGERNPRWNQVANVITPPSAVTTSPSADTEHRDGRPLHTQSSYPYYRDKYAFRPEDFPVAYREYQRLITLPAYPAMTDDDVDDVVEAVRDIATQFGR